jgi:hypothetical protein
MSRATPLDTELTRLQAVARVQKCERPKMEAAPELLSYRLDRLEGMNNSFSESFEADDPIEGSSSSEPLDHQLLRLASDRCELDSRERRLIAEARAYGWNNGDIGKVLGITRQAVGQKLRREATRRPSAVILVQQAQQRAEQRAIAHQRMRQLLQQR